MKNRLTSILNVIMVVSFFLTACSSKNESIQFDTDSQIKGVLKVLTIDSKENFMEDFGDAFNARYPNIEFEIINFGEENVNRVLEEEKPDVLLLSQSQFEQLIQENKLYDLDILMKNAKFNLEGVNPEIINYVRESGKGKLYGLPPRFNNRAIYYNKDLFDKYGIPYPQDGMTWEEVIQLAKRFPTEDGINGLYMSNIYNFVEEVAWANKLSNFNVKDMKVTINTESYREVFNMVLDAYQSGAAIVAESDVSEVYDPFINGTSAMTMDYYYYINNKISWAKAEKGDSFHLNWDVASAPVNESNRDISPYFFIFSIFAINEESAQKQVAWELVKFANSEEMAKARSKTAGFLPSSRTEYIYNPEGKRMEAFYNLRPDFYREYINYDLIPVNYLKNIEGIISSELKAVMVGAKTLDEAMTSMQTRGEQFIDKK